MKIINKIIFLLLSAVIFTSCYKEETINLPDENVLFDIKDSDDPLDHAVFETYNTFSSIIRYDYVSTEYQWNMVKSLTGDDSPLTVTKQEDRDLLLKGVNFVNKHFYKVYENKIDKTLLPFKVLLAKQVDQENDWVGNIPNIPVFSGLNYLLIGNIDEDIDALTAEKLQEVKEAIHGRFWGNYLYDNNRIEIPLSFFDISDGSYEDEITSANEAGFWYINSIFVDWGNYGPDQAMDAQQFFGKIVTTPYSTLKPILDANQKLKDKYEILTKFMLSEYNLDIQAIGNAQK